LGPWAAGTKKTKRFRRFFCGKPPGKTAGGGCWGKTPPPAKGECKFDSGPSSGGREKGKFWPGAAKKRPGRVGIFFFGGGGTGSLALEKINQLGPAHTGFGGLKSRAGAGPPREKGPGARRPIDLRGGPEGAWGSWERFFFRFSQNSIRHRNVLGAGGTGNGGGHRGPQPDLPGGRPPPPPPAGPRSKHPSAPDGGVEWRALDPFKAGEGFFFWLARRAGKKTLGAGRRDLFFFPQGDFRGPPSNPHKGGGLFGAGSSMVFGGKKQGGILWIFGLFQNPGARGGTAPTGAVLVVKFGPGGEGHFCGKKTNPFPVSGFFWHGRFVLFCCNGGTKAGRFFY